MNKMQAQIPYLLEGVRKTRPSSSRAGLKGEGKMSAVEPAFFNRRER